MLRMTGTLPRVRLEVLIRCQYLHQDTGKIFLETANMRSYGMYSKCVDI